MKLQNHKQKIEAFENTIKKLDLKEDSETLIEIFMLVSSHYINAAMHKIRTVKEDRDIKHNKLTGFLKRENSLKEYSEETADQIQILEDLRPSYVYGKSKNGDTAEKALEAFNKIKSICNNIIEDEQEPENSN